MQVTRVFSELVAGHRKDPLVVLGPFTRKASMTAATNSTTRTSLSRCTIGILLFPDIEDLSHCRYTRRSGMPFFAEVLVRDLLFTMLL